MKTARDYNKLNFTGGPTMSPGNPTFHGHAGGVGHEDAPLSARAGGGRPSHTPSNHARNSMRESQALGSTLIPVINRLQDIFATAKGGKDNVSFDLPQVAVVGSQSSGKSSVLEALVGRDFLPRGPDICTRRPLVLQLVQTHSGNGVEWGEFLHLPGQKFTDFTKIREEIERETDRETGSNKGISNKQIRLKICSPHVLTMTLVDLPGITKVPVGDQPTDIEEQIRRMINTYIQVNSCIILAVSPANVDLANSEAINLARAADPRGDRTIGVITKLDIMDRGTDARKVLKNEVVPLRLGYVGVVNRCQADIQGGRTIRDAMSGELQFFSTKPEYREVADKCGTRKLAAALNQILAQHIRHILPDLRSHIKVRGQPPNQILAQHTRHILPGLRSHIKDRSRMLAEELASYGEVSLESKAAQGGQLLKLLTEYSNNFNNLIEGKGEDVSTKELSGGARIRHIFGAIFTKSLQDLDPCDGLSDDDIRHAIQNSSGVKPCLLMPEEPFEMLARKQVSKLLEPCLQCSRFVYDDLVGMMRKCEPAEMARFPALQRALHDAAVQFLSEGAKPAQRQIESTMDCELGYINTAHPEFIGAAKAVKIAHEQIMNERLQEESGAGAAGGGGDENDPSAANGVVATGPFKTPVRSHPLHKGQQAAGAGAAAGGAPGAAGDGAGGAAAPGGLASWLPSGVGSMFGSKPKPKPEEVAVVLEEPPQILKAQEPKTDEEKVEVAVTKVLLRSYYGIVRKTLQDHVPKAIMHFLINHAKKGLQQHLIQELYKEDLFDEMMAEREDVALKRRRCSDAMETIRRAERALDDLPAQLWAHVDESVCM